MYEELLAKAKEAKDEKELYEMAKKEGIELTEESIKSLFKRLNSEGELSDDDLDSVSGGGCQTKFNNHVFTVVTSACNCFTGKYIKIADDDRGLYGSRTRYDNEERRRMWKAFSSPGQCGHCAYLEFLNGDLGYCGQSGKTDANWNN